MVEHNPPSKSGFGRLFSNPVKEQLQAEGFDKAVISRALKYGGDKYTKRQPGAPTYMEDVRNLSIHYTHLDKDPKYSGTNALGESWAPNCPYCDRQMQRLYGCSPLGKCVDELIREGETDSAALAARALAMTSNDLAPSRMLLRHWAHTGDLASCEYCDRKAKGDKLPGKNGRGGMLRNAIVGERMQLSAMASGANSFFSSSHYTSSDPNKPM